MWRETAGWAALFCPGQTSLYVSDREEQHLSSLYTKFFRYRIMNSSESWSTTVGFSVLATNLGTMEKCNMASSWVFCLTQRACATHLQPWLRPRQWGSMSLIKSILEDSFRSSQSRQVKHHNASLSSQGEKDLSTLWKNNGLTCFWAGCYLLKRKCDWEPLNTF